MNWLQVVALVLMVPLLLLLIDVSKAKVRSVKPILAILILTAGPLLPYPVLSTAFSILGIIIGGLFWIFTANHLRKRDERRREAVAHAANPDETPEIQPPPNALWPPEDAFGDKELQED